MGKRTLSEKQVKSLRILVKGKPIHALLLNLGVDLMLRSSDLLNLKVSDVVTESGKIRTDMNIKKEKTGQNTLNIPLSKNSQDVIKKYLLDRDKDSWIFLGNKSHYTKLPITQKQYSRIVKGWVSLLGVEDTIVFSTHSLKKTLPSIIYAKTQ